MPSKYYKYITIWSTFCREANTPLSIISTELDPSSLTYEQILNKYLYIERVHWEELISEENCDLEARSDVELEQG